MPVPPGTDPLNSDAACASFKTIFRFLSSFSSPILPDGKHRLRNCHFRIGKHPGIRYAQQSLPVDIRIDLPIRITQNKFHFSNK